MFCNKHHFLIIDNFFFSIKEEKERLNQTKSQFTEDEFQEIVNAGEKLKQLQESPDLPRDINSIPHLKMNDIPNKVEKYPIEVIEDAFSTGVTMLKHEVSSSQGIVHVQFGIDVSNVKYEDIEFLPLICSLMEKGTKQMNAVDFHRAVETKTGGISVLLSFNPVVPYKYDDASFVTSGNNFKTHLFVSSKNLLLIMHPRCSIYFAKYWMMRTSTKRKWLKFCLIEN